MKKTIGLLIFTLGVLVCVVYARNEVRLAASHERDQWACAKEVDPHCCAECAERCRTIAWGLPDSKEMVECMDLCTGDAKIYVTVDLLHDKIGGATAIEFGRVPGDDSTKGNRMFIAQQDGNVSYSRQGHNGPLKNLLSIRSYLTSLSGFYDEEGLLGLALHPEFYANGRFFIFYTAPDDDDNDPACSFGGATGPGTRNGTGIDGRDYDPDSYATLMVLAEFVFNGDPDDDDEEDDADFVRKWLVVKHPFTNHNGIDNLMFDENGALLVVMGDGGCKYDQFGFAQNRTHLLGKILVVNVDPDSITPEHCSQPVGTFDELDVACENNTQLIGLYASGVRNGGHVSMDCHLGRVNKYFAQVGQNKNEAIYRFHFEDNFGWVYREGFECTCYNQDPNPAGACDFSQNEEECIYDFRSLKHAEYCYPLVAHNQLVDRVSSIVGGHVYRGHELPCSLRGALVYGEWSRQTTGPGFPARFIGEPFLWVIHPDIDGDNADVPLSHSKLIIGDGLVGDKNYLWSMGYDIESKELYIGTNGLVAPVFGNGTASTLGRIYKITCPLGTD